MNENEATREDWRKFTKLAAEGRAFLIPLHHPFLLPGDPPDRAFSFVAGLERTEQWQRELQGGDEQLRRDYERENKAGRAAMKTLLDLVRGNLSADEAAGKLKAVGNEGGKWPDPAQLEARLRDEPGSRELLQHLLQFGELRLAAVNKQLAEVEQTVECITALGTAALDHHDAFAAGRLADIAHYAVTVLDALAEQRTELVRPFAREALQWPVMADVEPDWQGPAQERLKRLQLGEDTLHGKFDKSKAYNLENVSRRYARGIVETLEKNRCCAAMVAARMGVINAKEERDGFMVFTLPVPAWFERASKLPPFGPETAEVWLDVGIEMLKEQQPHLPQSPDWARIKTHWENRGDKPTPGRLWNSIKDALRSPLKTIARDQTPAAVTQE